MMTYLVATSLEDHQPLGGQQVGEFLNTLRHAFSPAQKQNLLNLFPISETNKFHYFDQYFNLVLGVADSGNEELLINNITVVSNFLLFLTF